MLIAAIGLITAALAFYSVGVWAERVRHLLRWWHAAFFAAGFACDLSGTILMTALHEHVNIRGEHREQEEDEAAAGEAAQSGNEQPQPAENLKDPADFNQCMRVRQQGGHDGHIKSGMDEVHDTGEDEEKREETTENRYNSSLVHSG